MKKRMQVMLAIVGVLFGSIFLWKVYTGYMMKRYLASQAHLATVTTVKVASATWQPTLNAVGSLRAIRGVDVTTELAGMVQHINFTPGAAVHENELLVQLNADAEIGQLQSLTAQAQLAEMTYKRDKAQYAIRAVSKQTLDTDLQNWKSLQGQVAQQQAIVLKKSIRAPFSGKLGINLVNPGQYINPGDKIVSLQTLNPIYVDFYVPQQALTQLAVNQTVIVTTDVFPKKQFKGKITTINPAVDVNTRNVQVEATIDNPLFELNPGMYVSVTVAVGHTSNQLILPQTAVSYNPYGNIVFRVEKQGKDEMGHPILLAKQLFVTTGDTRGDQVAIVKGIKKGETVVSSGQLKLKNGSRIVIDNTHLPDNSPTPHTPNEHEE